MIRRGFREGQLGDLVRLKRGYDLPYSCRVPGDVPVISSSGHTGSHNVAKVPGPGVVTGRYGTLGEVFYIDSDFWPLNTALYVQDFKGNHPRFVRYFLETLGLGAKNSAGAVPGVNRNVLHKMRVFAPTEFSIQRRIADILSAYDDLIENNNRRMALLEETIHLIYREWFVHLRFPGSERIKIVDGVPRRWKQTTAVEIIRFNPRTEVSRDLPRPFVPMGSLSTYGMQVSNVETRIPKGGARFRNGDTLLARITPCLENGKTAFVQFMETSEDVATGSTEFIVMRGFAVPPSWVYCLARSDGFRQHAINNLTGSDGRQRVSKERLESFNLLRPPPALLDRWAATVDPDFAQIRVLEQQNQRLKEARDLLLPRLMDGRIPV